MAKVNKDISSSLNEIDNEMKKILLKMITVADTRTDNEGNPLWTADRIFMTTSSDIDEIKYSAQMQSGETSLSFPFMAYSPDKSFESIDHAMGNRMNEAGVVLSKPQKCIDPEVLLTLSKSFQSKYTVSIWDDDFKTIRYYQDKISLKAIHNEMLHSWKSPILNGALSHFSYLIGMPVINSVATNSEKLKGSGFMYGLGINVDVWGSLFDKSSTEPAIQRIVQDFDGVDKHSIAVMGEIE